MFVVLVAVKELPLLDGADGCGGGGGGAAASKSNRTTGEGTHLKIPRVSVATLYAFLWGHLRGERTKCALAPTYRLKNFCQLENSSVRGNPHSTLRLTVEKWQPAISVADITHTTRNGTQKSIKIITRHVDLSGEQTLLKKSEKVPFVWAFLGLEKNVYIEKKNSNRSQ